MLVDLIRSMTPSEKRYFKVFAEEKLYKGKAVYLQLFEELLKHGEDGAKMIEETEVKALQNNFSYHKNYLYNQILKALRLYHANNDHYIQLQESLIDIRILLEKKLVTQAVKRINAAKKMARKYHYDIIMIKLLLLERSIIRGYTEKKSLQLLEEAQNTTQKHLTHLMNSVRVMDLYDRFFLISRNKITRDQYFNEMAVLLEKEKNQLQQLALPFEGQMTYHLLYITYYQMFTGEPENSLLHLQALIAYFESDKNLIDEYTSRYINVLNNYLNFCYLNNDFDSFESVINKLKKLKSKSKTIEVKLFQTIYHLEMVRYISTKQYHQGFQILPALEKGLHKYKEKIPNLNRLLLTQNMALIYFHTQNYGQALKWIRVIINQSRQDIRQDVNLFCRILELLIHYELEEFELVENLARSIMRSTYGQQEEKPADAFAHEVAKCIRKATKMPPHKVGKSFYALRNSLSEMKVYINGKAEVIEWLNRMLN